MKIIIFGATGGVGQQLIKQALEKNHEVTAFVRNPEKLTMSHEKLNVVVGDVFNLADVKKALVGHDVVVSTLGNGEAMKKSNKSYLMTKTIVDGMKAVGLTKLVYTASQGIDKEIPGLSGKFVMFLLRNPLADHKEAVNYIRANKLNAVIVRPSGLTHNELTGEYREAVDTVPPGPKSLSRADVAHFILKAIETNQYDGQSVAIAK